MSEDESDFWELFAALWSSDGKLVLGTTSQWKQEVVNEYVRVVLGEVHRL